MSAARISRRFFSRTFAAIAAASSAAAAVEGGRRPATRDLDTLGMDPASFPATYRR